MAEIDQRENSDQAEIKEEVPSILKAPHFNPRKSVAELTRYGITGGLTVLSSFGIEAAAFTGATITAGINPLANLDTKYALVAVAISYIPLFTGMLKIADQSWYTLKETGVSVNMFAKFGYDLSRKITRNERVQKAATYTTFLGLELAKEVPWWIGAFTGKEIISDWVPELTTPNIEYAFLTGANIFAAGYEYAQVGGVELALRGWRNRNKIGNLLWSGKNGNNQEKSVKDLK
ncbi:MAG: hypothetical protein Q7R43_00945 [Candidatus Daviesbacteria bacterium]|nr:hypothetical protein [Candidatus Daviesbacteria bacterium]